MPRTALLFLVSALIGCGPRSGQPTDTATVTDSAGVRIVTSRRPLWAAGKGWQVDSAPMTVIGADESDPQQQWKWIEGAARFADGRVVIAVEGSLRLFGADGKFIRLLSRAGDGPGEFRHVEGLLVLPGDSLRVNDYIGRRVATYAPDGTLAHDERLDTQKFQALGHWSECWTGLLPDGSRFTCEADSTIPRTATNRPEENAGGEYTPPGPGLLRQLHRVVVIPPTLDTVYPLGLDAGIEQFMVMGPRGMTSVIHPFYAISWIAGGGTPMHIAIATNPDYQIQLWSATGRLESIIRRAGGRRAPTAAEVSAAAAEMPKDNRLTDIDAPTLKAILAKVPVPDTLPAVVGLSVSPAGELFVQREGYLPSQARSLWDVFDTDGRWLGEIQLPGKHRILAAGADFLLALHVTDEGLTLVEVHRVRRFPTLP